MEYSAGSTLTGPHQRRWGCDHGDCTNTISVEPTDALARKMAQIAGWRVIAGVLHICPTHVENIGRG